MIEQLESKEIFENDGERNRLVIELDGNLPVIEYQVDMIRNNRITGLLPLEMRRVDSRIMLYYDVTGKWVLKDLLDNKEFSGGEFIALLEKFIQALTGAEAYLLDATQFALDEEHIFIEGNMEPKLMYLPVKTSQNIHERFKSLLLQLIVYRARLKDQDSGPVLSGILNYMKRDSFNLYEFQKALRSLSGAAGNDAVKEPVKAETPCKRPEPLSLIDLIPKENREQAILPEKSPEPLQIQPVEEYRTQTRLKTSIRITILVFQVILAVAVVFGFGAIYEATEDMPTAYAAMALMVLCVDGLVLKNLLKPENRVTVQIPIKRKAKAAKCGHAAPGKPPIQAEKQLLPVFPVNFNKQTICNAPLATPGHYGLDTEVLGSSSASAGANDTVVLSAQSAAPYLARKGSIQEIIKLKNPALVLGRQADMADYVIDDPTIGRMHAEVSWTGDSCQIRDLNSKNGTYVNKERLTGPGRVSIFTGDEIRLGSLEYTLVKD